MKSKEKETVVTNILHKIIRKDPVYIPGQHNLVLDEIVEKEIMAEKKSETIKLWERNGKSDL